MIERLLRIGAICWLLQPAGAWGHEINFDGKLFTRQDLMEWCIGNLTGLEDDGSEVVDAEDVTELVALFGTPCPDGCLADWNHNHVIGEGDLRVVLGNWGVCRPRADVDGDGVVDLEDAAAVVADLGLDCRPDLDYSGVVEGNDLNLAQLAWGPGDDHQGDVDRDNALEIGDDLLAVVDALGRHCTADVDFDGTVECEDLEHVCSIADIDCCDLAAAVCPDPSCET